MGHLIEEKHSADVDRAWLMNRLDDIHRATRAAKAAHEANNRRRAQYTARAPFATTAAADAADVEIEHARRMFEELTKFAAAIAHVDDQEFVATLQAESARWRETHITLTEDSEKETK